MKFCTRKKCKNITNNHLICVKHKEIIVKGIELFFFVGACKCQDFAKSPKNFAWSHDRDNMTFRNSDFNTFFSFPLFSQRATCYQIAKIAAIHLIVQHSPLFKSSNLWADDFFKSICPYVCLSVCSLLRNRLNVFLTPLSKVGCSIFLEIGNPWGKVMQKSCLRIKNH